MPRILRARVGSDYRTKLTELIAEAADGDEIRLFCQGAIIDAKATRDRLRPELKVTFAVESMSELRQRAHDVSSALLSDKSVPASPAACKHLVSTLLGDEGFDEFLEPHTVAGATWYDANTGIAIVCTDEPAHAFRQRIQQFGTGFDVNCCVIVWALSEQRFKLSEDYLVDVIESVPVWYVRKLVG